MIKVKVPYLNDEFFVEEEEPTTLAEITAQIGEFRVLQKFIKHLRYHYKYRKVYAEVAKKLAPLWTRKEGLTDAEYLEDFLRNSVDITAPRPTLQRLFDEVAPKISLLPSGERGGEAKISQGALEAATQTFAKGQQEAIAENIESVLIDYKIARDVNGHITLEGLARGIQKLNRELIKQATQKSTSVTQHPHRIA